MTSPIRNPSSRDEPRQPRPPSKLRLLRVFALMMASPIYCARHAGRLIAIAWFPCLLESVSRLGLEWLLFSYPPKLPALLVSDDFNPPTWLTAFVPTPWAAMAWAFILSNMADGNSKRGSIPLPALHWLRFELSPPIFIAAAIFSAANVFDGLIRLADRGLLLAVAGAYDYWTISDAFFAIWGNSAIVIRIALSAMIMAWIYPLAGSVLRTGTLHGASGLRFMRGNRLRLAAVFFLLTIALSALDRIIGPAKTWLVRLITDPPSWTLKSATVGYVVDFPVSMLWIVLWAVTVGLVLEALEGSQQSPTDRRARVPS